jgi:cytochrome P450 family 114
VTVDQNQTVDVVARLFEPDVLDDPSEFYTWLREYLPVHRHHSGAYFVVRHADVSWRYASPELRAPEPSELSHAFPRLSRSRAFQRLNQTVAVVNPPAHTRLRRLLVRDFTVKTVANLLPAIEVTVDALLDRIAGPLRDGMIVDLHAELSVPLADTVICDLIGIDPPDRAALSPLATQALWAASPVATDEMITAADAASGQIEAYYDRLVPQRRAHPRDDLISAFVAARDNDEDRLSHDELMSMLWGLWAAGFHTTAAGVDNAILTLLRHPDQAHWLRGGRAEVRAFVNESLRYRSPSHFSSAPRVTATDVEVGGVTIPKGSDVRALSGCANRDPAVFPDPDRFDPSRDTSAMLTFGHGIHYCVGSNLTRVEADVALRRLHARFPTLTLAEPPVYRRTPPLLALDRLAVAIQPG